MDPRLAGWRADPARRAATNAARAEMARAWATDGPLAVAARALDALQEPSAEAVEALVRPLLDDAGWLHVALAALARRVRDEPLLDPPLVPIRNAVHEGLVLLRHRHVVLFAGVGTRDGLAGKRMGPRAGVIVVPGQLGLVRVLSGGGATLSFWNGGWRRGAPAPWCEPAGTRRLVNGEVFSIDGRTTGYVVEHAQGDMVLLQATILADPSPTLCEYHAGTRELLALGAAREEASRTQLLTTLLAELDLPAGDAFDAASRAREPFARWHAIRQWVSIDADAARPRLAEMARADPDAELRLLAARTLDIVPCHA